MPTEWLQNQECRGCEYRQTTVLCIIIEKMDAYHPSFNNKFMLFRFRRILRKFSLHYMPLSDIFVPFEMAFTFILI
jgi:hypothetical protein